MEFAISQTVDDGAYAAPRIAATSAVMKDRRDSRGDAGDILRDLDMNHCDDPR